MPRMLARGALAATLPFLATVAMAADPAPLTDDTAKASYALGYQIGLDVQGVEYRPDAVMQGLQDGASGGKAKLTPEEMRAALQKFEQQVQAQKAQRQEEHLKKTAAAGKAYMDQNAKEAGVKTTASGLQYRVIAAGAGKKPAASDTVTVNYRGTLIDGTEFDSSYARGQPATFPLNGVIAGWTEGLQLMQEGGKSELVIPAALAYGDKGPLAGQVLVFEVELIKVGAPEPGK
ncbi:MAG TPA: FKBP-type peptidyl-prolyl cis-trans isomerase [Steroidobacteraceae bacterium]|nr:FKBP-type peptidyl-prolyl cis-trans isomerase [Steroidobacteraceae bacterium]